MKTVKTYSTRVDAEVAKIALAPADVPAVVVGIGTELEGGTAGVQLATSSVAWNFGRCAVAERNTAL